MAKKEKKNEQNIDGVLEELKKSYSVDASIDAADIKIEDASDDVTHDELQARLRSQFLSDEIQKSENASTDDYSIDEDFLKDAYDSADFEKNNDENISQSDEQNEGKIEKTEEYDYGFNEEFIEDDEEKTFEEEFKQETQSIKKASYDKSAEKEEIEEEIQEDCQVDKEINVDEGLEEIQEEEYNETVEEIYETQKDEEFQESVKENILLNDCSEDESFENDEEDEYIYNDIEEYQDEDEDAFELASDTRTPVEISEDNYVDVFYLPNDSDPYERMSFKEKISEKAPTVDSLEAELSGEETFEEVPEIKMTPIILDEDEVTVENTVIKEDKNTQQTLSTSTMENFDRSDLALLLEFGYTDEVLKNVSDEQMENLSDAELMDDIAQETQDDSDNFNKFDTDDFDEDIASSSLTDSERNQKLKKKLDKQYVAYREKRGGVLLRFIISAVVTLGLLVYELVPLLNSNAGGIFNRAEYFFAYVLIGLQLLIIVAVPSIKVFYRSFKSIFSNGIDAYCVAGFSLLITALYDFIVVFERKDIPPTFHFCAALIIVLVELSELMKLTAEIRNYEYYFAEYIFENDVTDVELYKYTLAKSEGRGSLAEKMYLGGLDENTVVYSPQTVDAAGGFFESSKTVAKKSKIMFASIIASVIIALMFTIASGILYEKIWVAAATFIITFNLTLPIITVIAEWIPFERLSSQNYIYGTAFASEGAAETLEKCDMLIFNDFHMFEACDPKNVNLAIYDSTSKAVLLSCLNSVYSEIGGPLQDAFSNVKVQPLGECKVRRIAKSGVEARVGSNYSVLIGDEQFMTRYGIFFPKAALGREEDKIFTVCVSINNRPTARIAVKYKINETFYNILQKLLEDKIYCTIQTYDPMISAELVAAVRPYKGAPVNIVHKSSVDYAMEKHQYKSSALYSVVTDELPVLARGSRLNLAVALSNAKKIRTLRKVLNISSVAFLLLGTLISLMLVLSERLASVNWLFVFIYWLLSGALAVGVTIWKFPQKDRFIFNKK